MPPRITRTRVAAIQLAYHPAALVDWRSPLEDPLFELGRDDSLKPPGGQPRPSVAAALDAIRARVKAAYLASLRAKLRAVLGACRQWGVRVAVLPEYSVPPELLRDVLEAAGDMTVVAGTHAVAPDLDVSCYTQLGYAGATLPEPGQAVAPVFVGGALAALQPKLQPAVPERESLVPGGRWEPVVVPPPAGGPLGVLICLDFLARETDAYRTHVGQRLEECRFLAVPSLTPWHSIPEFGAHAWEEARRYGRPVLYANDASGGGTSLYVDEGRQWDLRDFPRRVGLLEKGDEGVIVADVDLGYSRTGPSTPYVHEPPVVSVAAASLLYTTHPAGVAFAAWLAETGERIRAGAPVRELAARVAEARDVILNGAALPGGACRERRAQALFERARFLTKPEDYDRLLREVVLAPEALPLPQLRAAMASGAADAVFDLMKGERGANLDEVEEALRVAAAPAREPEKGAWTSEGLQSLGAVIAAVRGERAAGPPVEVATRYVLPPTVSPLVLGVLKAAGLVLDFSGGASVVRELAEVAEERHAVATGSARGEIVREFVKTEEGLLHARDRAHSRLEPLRLLVVAEGMSNAGLLRVTREAEPLRAWWFVVASDGKRWHLHTDGLTSDPPDELDRAMRSLGFTPVQHHEVGPEQLSKRVTALRTKFGGANDVIGELRERRLADVGGHFQPPDASSDADPSRRPALAVLDEWAGGGDPVALLLGEFGSGKSTVLAEWAARRWEAEQGPLPVVCNLAGAGPSADPLRLLLDACGVADSPAERAALTLLIRHRLLLPVFDGFDEIATRLVPGELAGRLASLLGVASGGGQVLVSAREHYFPCKEQLEGAVEQALAQALHSAGSALRVHLHLFDEEQVAALVRSVKGKRAASAALNRIATTYDLADLVHRPLLLGMVLQSLDKLEVGARVGTADVYEAYLGRWLAQTSSGGPEALSDAQKQAFAEALAEALWRAGEPSCAWKQLQETVRARLSSDLPEDVPPGAALLEIQGGAFFVWEGEDRYRFAHKSFLEYFLARGLVRSLELRPEEALDTRPITLEVAAFIGELLRRGGDPARQPAIQSLHAWLTQRRPAESLEEVGETAGAATNALRLLRGLARWEAGPAPTRDAWLPSRLDLRLIRAEGEDLSWTKLRDANLTRARLTGANLTGADLSGATLVHARLAGAILDEADLGGVVATDVDLTQSVASRARMVGADLTLASLSQAVWTNVDLRGARLHRASAVAFVGQGLARDGVPLHSGLPTGTVPSCVTFSSSSSLSAVAFSPDGLLVVTALNDGTARVWDAADGRELRRLEGHGGRVTAVAFSPDGARLLTGGEDSTARLWDTADGKELRRLEGHDGWVTAVEFSPNGSQFLTGGDDRTARLWDAADGRELRRFGGHGGWVAAVAFSPDGARLLTGGADKSTRVWNVADGRELRRLEGHGSRVTAVAYSPDGTRLLTGGGDGTARVWDAADGRELLRLEGHRGPILAVAYSPDGTRLLTGGGDGTARVWDAADGRELRRLEGHDGRVAAVAFSPDGARLLTAGVDGTARIWEAADGRELRRLMGHGCRVTAVAFSPDRARLLTGGDDRKARLWDVAEGRELQSVDGHRGRVTAVAISPDGERLLTGGVDKTVRLWNAADGRELRRLEGHGGWVLAVAFSPDGGRLLTGGDDRTARVWDVTDGRELRRLKGHGGRRVRAVAFSPDGTRLLTGGDDRTARLWDVTDGRELHRLEGHGGPVTAVAFSPDGARLLTGSGDRTARLWNAANGRELRRLDGHGGWVLAVAFSPDGARLLTGGGDCTARLWDAAKGRELRRLTAQGAPDIAVAFSPDGARLLTGGGDGTARLWDVVGGALVAVIEPSASLIRTPAGYFMISRQTPLEPRLIVPHPLSARTRLVLPLGGVRALLERPDKVRQALAGDLSGDVVEPELAALGWERGAPWDGSTWIGADDQPDPPPQPDRGASLPSVHRFRPGPALELPEQLAGRAALLAELSALVEARCAAVLLGPRRSGKTSTLRALTHALGDRVSCTYRTLELAPGLRTPDDVARLLDPDLRDDPRPAEALFARLEHAPPTAYLLDEVVHLEGTDPSTLAWLRALGQDRAAVLLAGTHWDWARVVAHARRTPGSSFGNDVNPVVLGPIEREDGVDLLTTRAPDDAPIEPATAGWVVDICGPWPFYLQVMGHALVQSATAGNRRPFVDKAELLRLYDQRLLVERRSVFEARLAELPPEARAVLLRIEDGKRPRLGDLTYEERDAVLRSGLCTDQGVWLDDKPFFEWVHRHRQHLPRQ